LACALLIIVFKGFCRMRLFLLIVPMAALGACGAPAPQSETPISAVPASAVFDLPMDPGQIQCDRLTNPAALSGASNWAFGQARAGTLSGRVAAVPDAATLSNNLARYCSPNGSDTVRIAAS
jgi:hypothetical protein